MTLTPAISFRGVTKRYRGGGGITGLNLEIWPGEVFGFLGPNGAGKSTTLRMLVDLLHPDEGTISVFGHDSVRESVSVRRAIGYLSGDVAFDARSTGTQVLSTLGRLKGIEAEHWESLAELFRADLQRPTGALSKGGRQKIGLVAALMGDPPLLVLDEPTTGLDPLVQQRVHGEVRRAASEGRTIFLSSHVLAEVGEMADRIGFIRDGVLAGIEPVSAIQHGGVHLVEVEVAEPIDRGAFENIPGATITSISGGKVAMELRGDMNGLISRLSNTVILDLSVREPTLEERFLSFYEGEATQ